MKTVANLTKPISLGTAGTYQKDERKPKQLSAPKGELKKYIIRLKEDCPVNQVVIFGVSFPKYQLHPDATLLENRGKMEYQFPLFNVFQLADNQLEEIKERAKITPMWVPSHVNSKGEFVEEFRGFAYDWLIFEECNKSKEYTTEIIDPPKKNRGRKKNSELVEEIIKD